MRNAHDSQKKELMELVRHYCATENNEVERMKSIYSRSPIHGMADMIKYASDQWVACIERIQRRKGFNVCQLEEDIKILKAKHKEEFAPSERAKLVAK